MIIINDHLLLFKGIALEILNLIHLRGLVVVEIRMLRQSLFGFLFLDILHRFQDHRLLHEQVHVHIHIFVLSLFLLLKWMFESNMCISFWHQAPKMVVSNISSLEHEPAWDS